jgi:hypothetical protein
MTNENVPKKIVSRRNPITGAKFFARGQERIMAVPDSYSEPKRLPPGERPAVIRARLWSFIEFDLTDVDSQAWADADDGQREDMVYGLLAEEMDSGEPDNFYTGDFDELTRQDLEQERIKSQANYLGITPQQFAWLEQHLNDEEFSQLSDAEMHRLLAEEYPGP